MNEKAVKELTKKGCIVAKDAAESLTEEDIEKIQELDSPPMYLSEKMLAQLRSDGERPEDVLYGAGDENSDMSEASGNDTDSGSPDRSSTNVTIKDTGKRKMDTKVEIIDEADISKEEKDVPEFLNNYNDRYDRMKKILMRRMEMKSAVTIQRLERRDEGEEATTIGLVKDKYSTRNGKFIVELEDKTGTFKALIDERGGERIVPDEVIGVQGSLGGDIIYANSVVRPDLPIPQGVNTTEQKVEAAYISDLHLGSIDTLEKRLDKFGSWLSSDEASRIKYLVIAGDIVEGVGVYPDQDEELEIADIYKQYQKFEEWAEKLPDDLQLIIGPGNHDIVRLAEPQPRLPEKVFPNISDRDNVHLVQNPQWVRLHGIESSGIMNLMYHGYSFDGHVGQIQDLREKAYDDPEHVMIDLLKRRHLSPTFGSNLLAPEDRDYMTMDRRPDVFVSGHFHSHANESYKGVSVICSSTFQAQTDFQKRVGHVPDPGKVTIVDYKNRKTRVKQF